MRKWIRGDIVILFLLAVAVGAVVKLELSKRFTIGYNDYRIENRKQQYDFKKMAVEIAKTQEESGNKQEQPVGGAACGQ